MKIVVAPDSFKGSISAQDICANVKKGIHLVLPEAEVIELPLADGGEGTMENMVYSSNGKKINVSVTGPLSVNVNAAYGVLGDGATVVIEMAQASGLPLIEESERNPLIATSFGTGELIRHALDKGYRKFIVGLGGSATNDAGTGMLKALGVKFYDESGQELEEGGLALGQLYRYDDSNLDPRIKESTFVIASDVRNKLCGPNGASAIFGPQKGATPEMVIQLDSALNQFAEVVLEQKGQDIRELEGGGAAGGMGVALISFLNAEVQSGIDVVMEKIRFQEIISDVDLIITGEGKLDLQTLEGKVISGVTKIANEKRIPVIALCGGLNLQTEKFKELGVLTAFSVVPGPCSLREAMNHTEEWILERTVSIMKLVHYYIS